MGAGYVDAARDEAVSRPLSERETGRAFGREVEKLGGGEDRLGFPTSQETLMSPTIGLPPPSAERCLDASRVSRFKGGTVIAEDVRDLDEHRRRMSDADAYRPSACGRCGNDRVHVHSRPERHPLREPSLPPVVEVLQFRCGDQVCAATWRVLPLFLSRHLWHPWKAVERAVRPSAEVASSRAPPVPKTTKRRWVGRLASSGRVLCALLTMSGGVELAAVGMTVGLDGTRGEVADAFQAKARGATGERLSPLAAVLHRLERGVRLM